MERLTRLVLRHRVAVLGAWFVVFGVCGLASTQLSELLTNRFTLPGTDTRRAEEILEERFGQRSTGSFTVIALGDGNARALVPEVRAAAERAAAELPTGRVVSVVPLTEDVVAAQIFSNLEPADSKGRTDDMRGAAGMIAGAEVFVTGQAAIERDLDPVFAEDLLRGEVIAIPIALLILVVTFGTLAFVLPFGFALVTIPTTLGIVWIFANAMELTTYLTNLVTLIGLGIAIDYSLLVIHRFREELARGAPRDEAIVATMLTAGRAVVFSGGAVAIGLALLLFMPLPFIRGFGLGGLVIPAVSVAAAVTLPAGRALARRAATRSRTAASEELDRAARGSRDRLLGRSRELHHALPEARRRLDRGAPPRARAPVLTLELGPGSNEGIRASSSRFAGSTLLSDAGGAGATAPDQIVVDTGRPGGAESEAVERAALELRAALLLDPQVADVVFDETPQHVDPSGRFLHVEVAGEPSTGGPRASSSSSGSGTRSSRVPASPTRQRSTQVVALPAGRTSSTSCTAGSRGSWQPSSRPRSSSSCALSVRSCSR